MKEDSDWVDLTGIAGKAILAASRFGAKGNFLESLEHGNS